jgi:hypothetical protein
MYNSNREVIKVSLHLLEGALFPGPLLGNVADIRAIFQGLNHVETRLDNQGRERCLVCSPNTTQWH